MSPRLVRSGTSHPWTHASLIQKVESMGAHDRRIKAEALKQFTKEIFIKAGYTPEGAETHADVLIWANQRGVDSHGVLQVPRYIGWVDKGQMKPKAIIRMERDASSPPI